MIYSNPAAKQMLLPRGDVMNWDSPIAKTQTNFSRFSAFDSHNDTDNKCVIFLFLQQIIYFLHVYSAYGT